MRIIGGRDYYDSAIAFGVDPAVVFVREESSLPARDIPASITNSAAVRIRGTNSYERVYAIIFCGMLYRGIGLSALWYNGRLGYYQSNPNIIWTNERFKGSAFAEVTFHNSRNPLSAEEFFTPVKVPLDFLQEHKIVIAVQESDYHPDGAPWAINGCRLSEYNFASRIPPVEAFQEIAQFVGGTMAAVGKPVPQIHDDKIKIAKHGLDKQSFRTRKKA